MISPAKHHGCCLIPHACTVILHICMGRTHLGVGTNELDALPPRRFEFQGEPDSDQTGLLGHKIARLQGASAGGREQHRCGKWLRRGRFVPLCKDSQISLANDSLRTCITTGHNISRPTDDTGRNI